jgi:hypothetical protein
LNGPRKKQAALAHTPPVPSYFKGLPDEDEDDDEDDDDREPNDEPEEWQSSDEDEQENKTGKQNATSPNREHLAGKFSDSILTFSLSILLFMTYNR